MSEGGITGKGFVKNDPRINRKGRPKNFDTLRKLAQGIAQEVAVTKDGTQVIYDNHLVTQVEAILRTWASSPDVRKQQAFMEYAYGKAPTTNTDIQIDVSNLTDKQLERLAAGDNLYTVLANKG